MKGKEIKMNKNVVSRKKSRRALIIVLIIVILLVGSVFGLTYFGRKAAGELLSQKLSEPLDGASSAKVTIDPGDGNLTIDKSTGADQMLASGTVQYFEKIGVPVSSVTTSKGFTTYSLKANGGQPWLKLPWSSCNGGTEWSIHLNPSVAYDITALTDGGMVKIDLTGLLVTHLSAETGGGNMEIVLPDDAANLDATVKTGAGKVTIHVGSRITGSNTINASSGYGEMNVLVPGGVEARIKVTQGNVVVDSTFTKIDDSTYETPGYQNATNKVEISVGSGAGNVNVNRK
jgi:hypothetical protein